MVYATVWQMILHILKIDIRSNNTHTHIIYSNVHNADQFQAWKKNKWQYFRKTDFSAYCET